MVLLSEDFGDVIKCVDSIEEFIGMDIRLKGNVLPQGFEPWS